MLNKSKKVFEYELPIKIEPQEEGYVVSCPAWSDCYAQGDTLDEALLEITAVAQSLIELYKEENITIPLQLQSQKEMTDTSISVPILTSV